MQVPLRHPGVAYLKCSAKQPALVGDGRAACSLPLAAGFQCLRQCIQDAQRSAGVLLADVHRQGLGLAWLRAVPGCLLAGRLGPDSWVQVAQVLGDLDAGLTGSPGLRTRSDGRMGFFRRTCGWKPGGANVVGTFAPVGWQRWAACLRPHGRRLVPVALNWERYVRLSAGFPQGDVADPILLGQLRHWHRPDLLIQGLPCDGCHVLGHRLART
jgi:hypothetical protein